MRFRWLAMVSWAWIVFALGCASAPSSSDASVPTLVESSIDDASTIEDSSIEDSTLDASAPSTCEPLVDSATPWSSHEHLIGAGGGPIPPPGEAGTVPISTGPNSLPVWGPVPPPAVVPASSITPGDAGQVLVTGVDGGLVIWSPDLTVIPGGSLTWSGVTNADAGTGAVLTLQNTATPNAFTINQEGDVAMGEVLTPDPTHHLSFEIMRSQNTDAAQTIRNRNSGTSARTVWHGFSGPADDTDSSISIAGPLAGGYVNWRAGGTTGGGLNFIQASNDFMSFYTNNLMREMISSSGYVYVGPTLANGYTTGALVTMGVWPASSHYGALWFGYDAAQTSPSTGTAAIAYDGSAGNGGSGTLILGDGATSVSVAASYLRPSSDLTTILGISTTRFSTAFIQTGITAGAESSDTAAQNFTILSEAPYASASVHTAPGSILLDTPAPVGSGMDGAVYIGRNGSSQIQIGSYNSVSGGANTYGAIWFSNFGAGAAAPSAGNFAFLGQNGATYLNTDRKSVV